MYPKKMKDKLRDRQRFLTEDPNNQFELCDCHAEVSRNFHLLFHLLSDGSHVSLVVPFNIFWLKPESTTALLALVFFCFHF